MAIVTLTKPIEAHGETLTELVLREPTVPDMRRVGLPFRMGGDTAIIMDAARTCDYISLLAGIPPSAVDRMAPADILTAFTVLIPFFVEILTT